MSSLEFAHSPAWLLLGLVLAIGLALGVYFYRRPTHESLSQPLRALLAALRAIALAALVLLLLEPVVTRWRSLRQPPEVALVIDDSQSLVAAGDTQFIRRRLPAELTRLTQALEAREVRVRPYRVGAQLSPLSAPDSLRYHEPATDLGRALTQLAREFSSRHHVATVLVSDGISTRGSDPRYLADAAAAPIFAVLVGDSTPRRDLRLLPLSANRIATQNAPTPIRIQVQSRGVNQARARVTLRQGRRVIAQPDIPLANGRGEVEVTYTPDQPGLVVLTADLTPTPGESNLRNNRQTVSLRVLDSRIRVLILASRPHPDLGALRRALARDPRFELSELIRKSPTEFYRTPTPDELESADVVLLHDFPSQLTDRALLTQLLGPQRKRRPGVAVVAGADFAPQVSPLLAQVLPLSIESVTEGLTRDAQAELTPAGRQHATTPTTPEFERWLIAGAPLVGVEGEWRPLPGATVVATARVQGLSLDAPWLALREEPGARSLLFTGVGLWRHRVDAFVREGDTQLFDGWWQSLVQWLAARDDLRRFRVFPAQTTFEGEDAVVLRAQALDGRNAPLDGAEVDATLTDSAGRQRRISFTPRGGGAYDAQLAELPEGIYQFTAQGKSRGAPIGTDRGQFAVLATTAEFQTLQADAPLMRQLALRSGGRFFAQPDFAALTDSLLRLPTLVPRQIERQRALPLLGWWPLMLLILACLSAEWMLRKRWGLI